MCDAVVIGAGQAGLAAAKALVNKGIRPVIVEAGGEPGGAWQHYYDSLALFSPARYSGLVGTPFPGDPDRYPLRDEVVAYLRDYAKRLDVDIRTNCRVLGVRGETHGYGVLTGDGDMFISPMLIAATGTYGNPFIPRVSGADTFSGGQLHAARYRGAGAFAGQRVVVVGAGNSAVQIAAELAETAVVTLASRRYPRLVPQRPLGFDMHFWYSRTGLDIAPVGPWLPRRPKCAGLRRRRVPRSTRIGAPGLAKDVHPHGRRFGGVGRRQHRICRYRHLGDGLSSGRRLPGRLGRGWRQGRPAPPQWGVDHASGPGIRRVGMAAIAILGDAAGCGPRRRIRRRPLVAPVLSVNAE